MAARWQQWMPLYIDRFLGSPDVQMMEPAEFKGYVCLLLAAWQTEDCSLPSDEAELAIVSRLGTKLWRKHSDHILRKFVIANGRLRNEVCYEEWLKASATFDRNCEAAEELKRKRSEAGKRGNRTRWGDRNLIASESQVRSQGIASGIANESQNIALTGTITGTRTGTGGTDPAPPDPAPARPEPIPETLEALPFDAEPEDNIPDGLAPMQYAHFVLTEAAIPAGYALKVKTGDAIEMLARIEACGMAKATKRLLDRMRAAQARGDKVNGFWLEDGRWKTGGASGSAVAERDAFLAGASR